MSVRLLTDGTIALEGECPVEDAESLQRYLLSDPQAVVDWRACESAHTAVVQVLLAVEPALRGPPRGAFLRAHLDPPWESGSV